MSGEFRAVAPDGDSVSHYPGCQPAVNGAIPDLVEARVLHPLSESQRNRAWEAGELLDLIVDLEAGEW